LKGGKWESNGISDVKVSVYGDTAIATGAWAGKGIDGDGTHIDRHERWTDTWVKTEAGSGSALPATPPRSNSRSCALRCADLVFLHGKTCTRRPKGEARERVESSTRSRRITSSCRPFIHARHDPPDETAAFHALHPFCDDGELNVGTHINIEHRALPASRAQVVAKAELESFDGRFLLAAGDRPRRARQEIGRGTVGRAVINLSQFMAKMKGKLD